MLPVSINYLAVVGAFIASMIIGSLWYSPLLLGKPWMKLMKWDEKKMKDKPEGAGMSMVGMALLSLLMAYILAHFVDYVAARSFLDAIILSIWLWLGFIVPTLASQSLFEKRPWGLFWISAAYYLVSLIVMSTILTLWV